MHKCCMLLLKLLLESYSLKNLLLCIENTIVFLHTKTFVSSEKCIYYCYEACLTALQVAASVRGHQDYSFASAWHPDGHVFATGNQDKTCRVWDVRNLSSPIAILKGNLGAVRSIRFSSDGQFMAVAEPADFVHVYSTKADYRRRQEIDFFGEISGVALSPDDESLYIGIWDRTYASLLQYNRRHTYGYLDSYL